MSFTVTYFTVGNLVTLWNPFGIMYSQFSVGPLLYICCSSSVPLLYIFFPPKGCKLPMVDLEQIKYRNLYLYQVKVCKILTLKSIPTYGCLCLMLRQVDVAQSQITVGTLTLEKWSETSK